MPGGGIAEGASRLLTINHASRKAPLLLSASEEVMGPRSYI